MVKLILFIGIGVALLGIGLFTSQYFFAPQNPQTVKTSLRNSALSSAAQVSSVEPISADQILAKAGNKYADGNLPLGDNKYTTDGPKKGYIYLCNVRQGSGQGAQAAGPWIHGDTWNIKQKISVIGKNLWPNAQFSNQVEGDTRIISGNDLPSHPTGNFPIQSNDPASKYDRNPNSIKSQSFNDSFPVSPAIAAKPSCMGGEAGVMLTGVALFNGFDEQYRDAAAYEVQDSCNGHPQLTGEYHYHSLSSCINFETADVEKEFERIKKIDGAKVIKEPYGMEGMKIATLADPDDNYFQLMTPWEG